MRFFPFAAVGAASLSEYAEMCMMAADTMEGLGIARTEFAPMVRNGKELDGIMDMLGLVDPADEAEGSDRGQGAFFVIGSNQEWRGSKGDQAEVPLADLVTEVKDVLARHL